jgi:hypothetical protein
LANNEAMSAINNTEIIDLTDRNILNRGEVSTIDNTEIVNEIIDLTDQDIEANRVDLAEDENLTDNDIETNIIDLADDTADEISEESHVLDIRSESFQIQERKRTRHRNINNDSDSTLHSMAVMLISPCRSFADHIIPDFKIYCKSHRYF